MMTRIKEFYRRAMITDHPLMVVVGNLRSPNRFLRRARYGQICGFLPFVDLSMPAKPAGEILDRKIINAAVARLRTDGICAFPSYFEKEVIEFNAAHLRPQIEYEIADRYDRIFFGPTGDPLIERFILNETMLTIAAEYYGCQPYLRHGPALAVLYPKRTTVPQYWVENGLQDWAWHIDTPNLLSFHIILNDTDTSSTRMLYAEGSHKSLRSVSGIRTEESVLGKYPVFDCCGPKGTLYVFDNNGLHRPHAVANSMRATFEFYFTPGNQIFSMKKMRTIVNEDELRGKRDYQHYGSGIYDEIRIPEGASPLQAETLRGMIRAGG